MRQRKRQFVVLSPSAVAAAFERLAREEKGEAEKARGGGCPTDGARERRSCRYSSVAATRAYERLLDKAMAGMPS